MTGYKWPYDDDGVLVCDYWRAHAFGCECSGSRNRAWAQARSDALIFGVGIVRVLADGTVEAVDPAKVRVER